MYSMTLEGSDNCVGFEHELATGLEARGGSSSEVDERDQALRRESKSRRGTELLSAVAVFRNHLGAAAMARLRNGVDSRRRDPSVIEIK